MNRNVPKYLAFMLVTLATPATLAGCGGDDTTGAGGAADSGPGDSGLGTLAETGGGTCSAASTCIGTFFGTCFDASGACTADGTTTCFAGGARFTPGSGGAIDAVSAAGSTCYSVTVSADGKTYTFTKPGGGTLVYEYSGNQARVTCGDGSKVNFTASAFDNSDCVDVKPRTGCAPGTCAAGG